MKKVGIVTMRGGENYGNALQNYAVQTLIEEWGAEAITIDNRTKCGFNVASRKNESLLGKLKPGYIKQYIRVRFCKMTGSKNDRDFSPKMIIRAVKERQTFLQKKNHRIKRFTEFRKHMLHDDTVPIDIDHINKEHIDTFDAFVCGSDQIWNPNYPQNSMIDFLQFAPAQKRIALAPSFGISEIPESLKKTYAAWIASIPNLSVREEAGAEIIKDLTGKDAMVLLDPTFGLSKEQWLLFAREPETKPKNDYVFCYFLGNLSNRYAQHIRAFARENHCEIVDVCDINDLRYYDIDPQEFVWLIAHAKAVFTDSFHGTAFSINLQIPFEVFDRIERGCPMSSRINTILHKMGMENRRFPWIGMEDIRRADFSNSEAIIHKERGVIKCFLRSALDSAME